MWRGVADGYSDIRMVVWGRTKGRKTVFRKADAQAEIVHRTDAGGALTKECGAEGGSEAARLAGVRTGREASGVAAASGEAGRRRTARGSGESPRSRRRRRWSGRTGAQGSLTLVGARRQAERRISEEGGGVRATGWGSLRAEMETTRFRCCFRTVRGLWDCRERRARCAGFRRFR